MHPSWRRRVTRWVRWGYDRIASVYDRLIGITELLLAGDGRAWIGRHAVGDTLELAIGTGRNLRCYREDVHVVGVDLSGRMLARAGRRAHGLRRPVALLIADARAPPFRAASFDTVVCTLALPAMPDQRAALAEIHRVLRPTGRMLLLDHVRSLRKSLRAAGFTIGYANRARLVSWRASSHRKRDGPLHAVLAVVPDARRDPHLLTG